MPQQHQSHQHQLRWNLKQWRRRSPVWQRSSTPWLEGPPLPHRVESMWARFTAERSQFKSSLHLRINTCVAWRWLKMLKRGAAAAASQQLRNSEGQREHSQPPCMFLQERQKVWMSRANFNNNTSWPARTRCSLPPWHLGFFFFIFKRSVHVSAD